jgi:hypothetical protein
MASDIIQGILEFLFYLFIEIICFYTGEIILSIISWGKKKPRWDYYADASAAKFVIFTEISTWIGMAFWVFIIGIVARP